MQEHYGQCVHLMPEIHLGEMQLEQMFVPPKWEKMQAEFVGCGVFGICCPGYRRQCRKPQKTDYPHAVGCNGCKFREMETST